MERPVCILLLFLYANLLLFSPAIAFFGSSICPVLPIKLFGIFCGLLIAIDYILDVLVMFPCLCIYDEYRFQRNYCMDLRCPAKSDEPTPQERIREVDYMEEEEKMEEEDEMELSKRKVDGSSGSREGNLSQPEQENNSLIRRMLVSYYEFLHKWRWVILPLSIAAMVLCCYFATTLKVPPKSSDIQLLIDSVEPEQARQWRNELLVSSLTAEQGGTSFVVWGLTPADTGNHLDPYEWSQLVLDDSFEPSSEEAQLYFLDFCEKLWEQSFAFPQSEGQICAINQFNEWLQKQSSLPTENQTTTYTSNCGGATAMPIPKDVFHPCLSSWAHQEDIGQILSWDGVVKVISIEFRTEARFDSPTSLLEAQWHLIEDWMRSDNQQAPPGVANAFFSSFDWWVWDINTAVYRTAIDSAAIAISVSALVILISSKSLSMTIFSAVSVAFVLVSVASVMSAAQWTLGFL